jgi:hypothetical protein
MGKIYWLFFAVIGIILGDKFILWKKNETALPGKGDIKYSL